MLVAFIDTLSIFCIITVPEQEVSMHIATLAFLGALLFSAGVALLIACLWFAPQPVRNKLFLELANYAFVSFVWAFVYLIISADGKPDYLRGLHDLSLQMLLIMLFAVYTAIEALKAIGVTYAKLQKAT